MGFANRHADVEDDEVVVEDLDRAWSACELAGLGLDEERMDAYAETSEAIARLDVDSVPTEPQAAVRHVVLGTVLIDPVLAALRRLAQQHTAVTDHSRTVEAPPGAKQRAYSGPGRGGPFGR